jgi:hypothetical protein
MLGDFYDSLFREPVVLALYALDEISWVCETLFEGLFVSHSRLQLVLGKDTYLASRLGFCETKIRLPSM